MNKINLLGSSDIDMDLDYYRELIKSKVEPNNSQSNYIEAFEIKQLN